MVLVLKNRRVIESGKRPIVLLRACLFPCLNNPLVFKKQGVTEAGISIDKYILPGKAYFRRDFPASITPWF